MGLFALDWVAVVGLVRWVWWLCTVTLRYDLVIDFGGAEKTDGVLADSVILLVFR